MAITRFERYRSLSNQQMVTFERRAAQAKAALRRRTEEFGATVHWYGERLEKSTQIRMKARVKLAGQLLRDKVVINVSRPVTKLPGQRRRSGTGTYTWVDPRSRSKPGEFPKAETGHLRRSIFYKAANTKNTAAARVGTNLGYGAALELSPRMRRSFLRRTLKESLPFIRRILVKPFAQGEGSET